MTDRLRWKPSLREHGRDRPLLRDPLRLGLLVGALVMAIGAFLPWAEGMIGFLRVQFGGFEGASDGLILVTFGLVVMFIARDRESLDASEGPRRWAPMLIGLVCVAVWLVAGRSAEITISHWKNDDGTGSLVAGYWITGIGAVAVAIVGSIAALRPHEGETASPLPRPRMPRLDDIESIAAAAGAVIGAIAAGAATLALFNPVSVVVPLLFFGFIGLALGSIGGRSVGARLRRLVD
jgi:hypothetical protein